MATKKDLAKLLQEGLEEVSKNPSKYWYMEREKTDKTPPAKGIKWDKQKWKKSK